MKYLSNAHLVTVLKNLVVEERKITAKILEYLREVERRKIYLEMGYPSLFEFCLKELQYSEGSAHRRISAMRLLKELPQVEDKIVSGELSLSVLSQAQSFFRKQEKHEKALMPEQKLELLEKLENTSARTCEKILLEIDPEPIRADRERPLNAELTEIRITVDREFVQKLERLKNLLSHTSPDVSTKEVLSMALDAMLEKKDPGLKKTRSKVVYGGSETTLGQIRPSQQIESSFPMSEVKSSRYIPNSVKKAVWLKSGGRCCYKNPKTGKQCGSKMFLELDHIIPHSKGGTNTVDNLQLLCDAHNRWKSNNLLVCRVNN